MKRQFMSWILLAKRMPNDKDKGTIVVLSATNLSAAKVDLESEYRLLGRYLEGDRVKVFERS